MKSVLEIKSLTLPVRLGRDQKERANPQEVAFHITIGFFKPLTEEKTDKLKDSVCYFAVCESVQNLVTKKHFCLIENVAGEVLKKLKKLLPNKTSIKVSVHKVKPPVPFLKGGVYYTTGDLSL